MNAFQFFSQVAMPLHGRSLAEPSIDLIWAAVVAVNQIADYAALENGGADRDAQSKEASSTRKSEPSLKTLSVIAEALKHRKSLLRNSIVQADSHNFRDDFLSAPDILAEPNILGAWVIEVGGATMSISATLEEAVRYWSKRFACEGRLTGEIAGLASPS